MGNFFPPVDIERVWVEGEVFDVGDQTGGLVIYLPDRLRGKNVAAVNHALPPSQTFHASAVERIVNGQSVIAAVFPRLPQGNYWVKMPGQRTEKLSVFPDEIAEADWR
jgi:hypothetical protein